MKSFSRDYIYIKHPEEENEEKKKLFFTHLISWGKKTTEQKRGTMMCVCDP
jgi:hypothetical protein